MIFLTDVKVMKNNTKPYLAGHGEPGTPPGMLQAISKRQAGRPGMPQKLPQRGALEKNKSTIMGIKLKNT